VDEVKFFGQLAVWPTPFEIGVHPDDPDGWQKMRDHWEYSHIARDGLASLSFLLLVVAAVTQG
jgi:hypothetical protein